MCPRFDSSAQLHFWLLWVNFCIFELILAFYKCASMSFLISQNSWNNTQPSADTIQNKILLFKENFVKHKMQRHQLLATKSLWRIWSLRSKKSFYLNALCTLQVTDLGSLIEKLDYGYSTVWKFSKFPDTLILREINFGWYLKVKMCHAF